MDSLVDVNLLHRYLSGEGTPEERRHVDAWLAADRGHEQELEMHRVMAREIRTIGKANASDAESMIRQLNAKMRSERDHKRDTPNPGSFVKRPTPYGALRQAGLGIAGLLLLVVGVVTWRHRITSAVSTVSRTYMTAAGQRETVRLPDGTQLTLAPESRIQVPAEYGHPGREVSLVGEAYFTVRHDAQHLFAVQTNGVTIRDVGTTFDVRAYAEDAEARVAVAEGSVTVNGATAVAGDVVIAAPDRLTLERHVAVADLMAWRQGTLVFKETPLRNAVRDISRAYGVPIVVADSALLTRRVTTTLSDKTLDVVLAVVSGVVGARFEHTAQGVVIRKRTADDPPAKAIHQEIHT